MKCDRQSANETGLCQYIVYEMHKVDQSLLLHAWLDPVTEAVPINHKRRINSYIIWRPHLCGTNRRIVVICKRFTQLALLLSFFINKNDVHFLSSWIQNLFGRELLLVVLLPVSPML